MWQNDRWHAMAVLRAWLASGQRWHRLIAGRIQIMNAGRHYNGFNNSSSAAPSSVHMTEKFFNHVFFLHDGIINELTNQRQSPQCQRKNGGRKFMKKSLQQCFLSAKQYSNKVWWKDNSTENVLILFALSASIVWGIWVRNDLNSYVYCPSA